MTRGTLVEKTLTLQVAQKIESILKERTDLPVVLTRAEDFDLPSDERKKIANHSARGAYVSLHFAAAPSPAVSGPRVFVLAAPKVGGTSLLIPEGEAHGAALKDSFRLAMLLSEELGLVAPGEPARIAPFPLAPLLGVTLPSALVELDFLTSAGAARWSDPAAVEEAALAVVTAIDRYLKPDVSLDPGPSGGKNPPP